MSGLKLTFILYMRQHAKSKAISQTQDVFRGLKAWIGCSAAAKGSAAEAGAFPACRAFPLGFLVCARAF